MLNISDPATAFIEAATVPLDGPHVSGTLHEADAILGAHPEIPSHSVYTAAVLGDEHAIRNFLDLDAGHATAKGGPRAWDALTYLCFSRYLRLAPARSDAFVRAAAALLDAGANANTGWLEERHEPNPEWESAIYGASGIAHHAGLTGLLLERGADPNDNETPYHTPETYDNAALRVLVESGRLTPDSLETMLLRKADWHDADGLAFLLGRGGDPNRMIRWPRTALHHALLRDNALQQIDTLLDYNADPGIVSRAEGRSAAEIAARRGRGDVLASLTRRGFRLELQGIARLLAACAIGDANGARLDLERETGIARELEVHGGTFLAEFAGNGNTSGVRCLLDLGVPVDSRYQEGDAYYDVAPGSLAIHVAAWRARHQTLDLLIARGSPIDAIDRNGRTPMMLAVRACVDSYWMEQRSPESVRALMAAGASARGVPYPSGYKEVDDLIGA